MSLVSGLEPPYDLQVTLRMVSRTLFGTLSKMPHVIFQFVYKSLLYSLDNTLHNILILSSIVKVDQV
jgi:hypothetical protein